MSYRTRIPGTSAEVDFESRNRGLDTVAGAIPISSVLGGAALVVQPGRGRRAGLATPGDEDSAATPPCSETPHESEIAPKR